MFILCALGECKLPLYQVVEAFKGTEDNKGFPLSKDAVVKVLDKKDHGTCPLSYAGISTIEIKFYTWFVIGTRYS